MPTEDMQELGTSDGVKAAVDQLAAEDSFMI
jgi:hypothetical protein